MGEESNSKGRTKTSGIGLTLFRHRAEAKCDQSATLARSGVERDPRSMSLLPSAGPVLLSATTRASQPASESPAWLGSRAGARGSLQWRRPRSGMCRKDHGGPLTSTLPTEDLEFVRPLPHSPPSGTLALFAPLLACGIKRAVSSSKQAVLSSFQQRFVGKSVKEMKGVWFIYKLYFSFCFTETRHDAN